MNNRKGFTLLELLMSVAIMAILVVLSTPIFTTYIMQNRLKGAGESLYGDLFHARAEAIKQQKNITVVFQTGANWCYGVTTASNCNCSVANNCTLGQVSYLRHKNTTLSVIGLGANTSFNGTRGVVSSTGTLSFTSNSGDSISLELNKMGFTKICSADLSGYTSC